MSTITIIGAGLMGTALCWPLTDNGHQVRLTGTPLDAEIILSVRKDRMHPTLQRLVPESVETFTVEELETSLKGSDWVVSGVSSFGVNWFADSVGPLIKPEQPVLAVTKGLEDLPNGDLLTLPEVIDRRLPEQLRGRVSLNAIGGPCTAIELADRYPACVVFCGKDRNVLKRLQADAQCDYYHVWTSTDLTGVEVAAALKNAYALAVGLGIGMMEQAQKMRPTARLYNLQSALFAQSTLEMHRLLKALGGREEHATWLPGPGDLYTTIFGGRTVMLGRLLGMGIPFPEAREQLKGITLESVEITRRMGRALPKLEARGMLQLREVPLLCHVFEILENGVKVDLPLKDFFSGMQ